LFSFSTQIDKLAKSGLLYLVTEKFAGIDLHPETVDNHEMGLAFEELIRRFAELSNETAGEHFTPREVIRLMVTPLLSQACLVMPALVAGIHASRNRSKGGVRWPDKKRVHARSSTRHTRR
jgi:type I restriction enzyme M protein